MFSVGEEKEVKVNTKVKRKNKFKFDFKFVFIIIILLVVIVFLLIYNLTDMKYRDNIFDEIIYTSHVIEGDEVVSYIPFINVDGVSFVNDEIVDIGNEILQNKKNLVNYDYFIEDNILSVLLKTVNLDDDYPVIKYYNYNIDLEKSKVISNEDLLEMFYLDEDDVSAILETSFEEFYDEEIEEGFLEGNLCDYNCFLELRGINDYLDDISYFINDNHLYAYRTFNIYSVFQEEEFFEDDDFIFFIK